MRVGTCFAMTVRELLRSRLVLILLLLIPTLFYALVALTTTGRLISFRLAGLPGSVFVDVSERSESLIFIGTAAVGFLASFLALRLIQKNAEASRRLVLCGFRTTELVAGKLAAVLVTTAAVAVYVALLLLFFFRPERFGVVLLGFGLAGFVYSCYGLLVGALFRRELEGILFIVLVANIDAGWLQNPVYFAGAQNQFIIRLLPAYFPSQTSLIGAFSERACWTPVVASLGYGAVLLAAALAVYMLRTRVSRQ